MTCSGDLNGGVMARTDAAGVVADSAGCSAGGDAGGAGSLSAVGSAGGFPFVDEPRLTRLLAGSMWHTVEVVEVTGSTNADLLLAARGGARHGTVRLAAEQTSGRGRFQRQWVSLSGASIAMSMLLEPDRPMEEWPWLSAATGMAVRQGLMDATGCAADRLVLKWPNDVLLDGLKVCGILAEQTFVSGRACVVMGVGINTFMSAEQLPIERATSVVLAGLACDPTAIVAAVLRRFDEYWSLWHRDGTLHDAYVAQLGTIGREVNVIVSADRIDHGVAVDVDDMGCLVVNVDGESRHYSAGDVVHLR